MPKILLAATMAWLAGTFALIPQALARDIEPPAETPACPAAGQFHSWNKGNQPTQIKFINNLDSTVAIYWVDFNGNWVQYATIPSRGQIVQPTYVGHAWVAWNTRRQDCVPASGYVAKADRGQWVRYHN